MTNPELKRGTKEYEISRIKLYKTTFNSCKCRSYVIRKCCRHIENYRKWFIDKNLDVDKLIPEKNANAVEFVEKYGENLLNVLKARGDVYEKLGLLWKLS